MIRPYTHVVRPARAGETPVLGIWHSRPAFAVPAGACDCHVHVFGTPEAYPLATDRAFSPGLARVDDLLAMHRLIGIQRRVIIQASPQGTDNRGVLDALADLRARQEEARAVAVVTEGTSRADLEALHEAGVRGLRVNLQSYGMTDPVVAARRLRQAAAMAEPLGWHVQIYTTLAVLHALQDTAGALPVPLVVDHFGLALPGAGLGQPGLDTLLRLVRDGRAWVKLSAPYRIVDQADGRDGEPLARALIDANVERMLWGTDWPHTGPWPGVARDVRRIEPFHAIDDGAQLDIFGRWTTEAERQRILVENPARLYGFGGG